MKVCNNHVGQKSHNTTVPTWYAGWGIRGEKRMFPITRAERLFARKSEQRGRHCSCQGVGQIYHGKSSHLHHRCGLRGGDIWYALQHENRRRTLPRPPRQRQGGARGTWRCARNPACCAWDDPRQAGASPKTADMTDC